MTPTKALILGLTCAATVALCWAVIGALTLEWRAIAAGLVLATCAGSFLWFARGEAQAAARGFISLGIVALTAPLAGLSALWNDAIYLFLRDDPDSRARLDSFDAMQALGFEMAIYGLVSGIVAVTVGWVWHARAGRRQG